MALHLPRRLADTGLVFCPPFGEEMARTYRRFAQWAKELGELGFPVLRFHPYGTGESDGTLAEFTLESACADAAAAVKCLRERADVRRVGLFGVRFGGSVAVHAACAARPDFLLLWSPIVNLRQYCRELLRLRLTKELVHQGQVSVTTRSMIQQLESGLPVDILGYELSPKLYENMTANPSFPPRVAVPEVLWLARPAEKDQALPIAGAWESCGCEVDLKFFPERVFWEEQGSFPQQFAAASCEWLARGALQTVSAR